MPIGRLGGTVGLSISTGSEGGGCGFGVSIGLGLKGGFVTATGGNVNGMDGLVAGG